MQFLETITFAENGFKRSNTVLGNIKILIF